MDGSSLPEPLRAPTRVATLLVCTTCKRPGDDADPRPGLRLHDALAAAAGPEVTVVGVECLSNCKRSCTVALTAEGAWSYVYGDLDPAASVEAILDGAAKYAATPDGLVPWRERPEIFRKGVIARVPPLAGGGR
jgi:predicted metal-binding protein